MGFAFSKDEARGAGFFTHHVNLVFKLGLLAMIHVFFLLDLKWMSF